MLLPSQRLWARGTQGSGATTASRNTEYDGCLLAHPKSGVSMCDKCPPAVRSMLAGKEEAAAAEKKRKAQLQQAAAGAGGLPARPVQQTI